MVNNTTIHRLLLAPDADVNSGGGSSVPPAETAIESQSTDVNESADTSNASADTKRDEKQLPKTVEDVVAAVKAKHNIDQPKRKESETSSDEKSAVPKENNTEEKRDKNGKVIANEDGDDGSKTPEHIPYARFKEKVAEANTLKEEVAKIKPLADEYAVYDAYCKQNRIVAADHQRALELVALTQSNPAEAIKQLEAIANGLKLQAGQILPIDLQKQVDEGEMTERVAKDIAKLRLEKGKLELGQKAQAESHVQQQQQQLNQSLNSWTQSKMKTDLDFHPKSDANAPDGRYELVLTKFRELWQTTPVYSIDEAVGLAERAYKSVMEYHSQYVRKPAATRKPLTSNGSSTTKAEQKIDVTKAGWGRQVARSVINGD